MKLPRLLSVGSFVLPLTILSGALAATPAPDKAKAAPKEKSGWVFSLLPKSLQQNPNLDLTVITETSPEGKKLPPVSSQHPAYYLLQSAGYRQFGNTPAGEKTVPPEDIERIFTRALAANGYLPASEPAHPATLVVIYNWGAHFLLQHDDDAPENDANSAQAVARNVLDRAALVGGSKFAAELKELFSQADAQATLNYTPPPDPSGTVPPIDPVVGADQAAFANPVNLFKMRDPKNAALVELAADDCYFVVATAYDAAALAKKQRVLLWRTRMTVNAHGINQLDSLPTLIIAAAPYFGKEMDSSALINRRVVREGQVDVGTPVPIETDVPLPKKKK